MNRFPTSYTAGPGLPMPTDAELIKAYDLHVSRMLAGAGDMAWGFMPFVHAIFGTRDIDAGMREVIGLRVAKLLHTPYQWQQHATMGRNAGLTVDEIDAVAADGPVTGLSPDRLLLCTAADELTKDAVYANATLDQLRKRYGDEVTRKITLTIGFFNLLSRFLNGCRVPLESSDKMGDRTVPY